MDCSLSSNNDIDEDSMNISMGHDGEDNPDEMDCLMSDSCVIGEDRDEGGDESNESVEDLEGDEDDSDGNDEGFDEEEMQAMPHLLLDNTALREFLSCREGSLHPKEMNTLLLKLGRYHTRFPILRRDLEGFQKYTRMSIRTFDYILDAVAPLLVENWNQRHGWLIGAEGRLVVTMR
ncbi:hypothetical protein QAD02_018436 [Eretmocerus hayati]|uniref:Uncharacterized protein n=1 Tax=Eretmocerus hayati TaxID=131215 RepID=A0ACC2PGD4_9HYME|nr:hypothetical protein QAD02_018436 [Eretmocerus hayati]